MSKNTGDGELREKLAEIEHERWADWQKWCHQILRDNCPAAELEKVLQRWDKQIATPYSLLPPAEKASDMEQVDRYWPLIKKYAAQEANKAQQKLLQELMDKYPPTDYGGRDYLGGFNDARRQFQSAIQNKLEGLQ